MNASPATIDALAARGTLLEEARKLRDAGHGAIVSYSRKVFIPLTRLCRDVCSYCTFAQAPRAGGRNYLGSDEVLAIARAGAAAGCHEALFTLGDKPELRYRVAREELERLGHATTLSYLAQMCRLVFEQTGLFPHVNAGTMSAAEIGQLREVSISQGLMLESASDRLCQRGGPHFGSLDKAPSVRLETIRLAGEMRVPFTSGILIGIGETWAERIEALVALRDLHARYGHLQEIIIQNFRAKTGTRMEGCSEPDLADLQRTIAAARVLFGPAMNIQAPPNLSFDEYGALLEAGINDWGGVSPVTPDHVNPEAPWPELDRLAQVTAAGGKTLVERLAIYPEYALDASTWVDGTLKTALLHATDTSGYPRMDPWHPGSASIAPKIHSRPALARPIEPAIGHAIAQAVRGERLDAAQIKALFGARGADVDTVCEAADRLRRQTVGDTVSYVVNRNINYTNVCFHKCGFCAFSKAGTSASSRGRPYDLVLEEVIRRAQEAWQRGATEVCMQGGIHPDYTGQTYLELCRAVKQAIPSMHVHAFSPLEVRHGAATLGLEIPEFLVQLKQAGLGTLPGTAAEILDDAVRKQICPGKLTTHEWLETMAASHRTGFRTTSTIMFGHVETVESWAAHLLHVRDLQQATGGFTEFVPLPFVHTEAPMYRRGLARRGPTFREVVLMHAIARLVLHPLIPNIQTSWVKLGRDGARKCLQAGANDLGGTLMNESISRAAGAAHGQELPPAEMERLIRSLGRTPRQRTTLYADAPAERIAAAGNAAPLSAPIQSPLRPRRKIASAAGSIAE